MIDSFSPLGLLVSLLLPWIFGCIWVRSLVHRSNGWNWFIVIGHGYLAGVLFTTLYIRAWSGVGLSLEFWPMVSVLAIIAAAGLLTQKWKPLPSQSSPTEAQSSKLINVVIVLLLGLVALRYLTLLQELSIRPLYAWDAWMNWSPKAVVWFYMQELTGFVSPPQWLAQTPEKGAYTLGNYLASTYPNSVPLITLWTMLGAGTDCYSLIYLPWLIAVLSLGLAMYGHLRLSGSPALLSCVACYLLLSLPYLNVHTALVGYADIWLAATFGMAIFSLYTWQNTRTWGYALLCIFYAVMCSQLKNPGIILGLIMLFVFLRSLAGLKYKAELIAGVSLAFLLFVLVISDVNWDLPYLGNLSVSRDAITVPFLGSFAFEYHDVSAAFIQTFFYMLNWNTACYIFILFVLLKIFQRDIFRAPSSVLLAIALTSFFILFVFFLTKHHGAASDFTTINRALLYLAPPLIFYLCIEAHYSTKKKSIPNELKKL